MSKDLKSPGKSSRTPRHAHPIDTATSPDEPVSDLVRASFAAPVDGESASRLARDGLRLGLVDISDAGQVTAWLQAESRGFHQAQITQERLDVLLPATADHRNTGVWDDTIVSRDAPISTVSSWLTELTVPGETAVSAWAISAVTVSPTHRRRGIARALLEAELRTANALGVAVAILTVSEATIYGRFGFGAAVFASDWQIESRRADWNGPTPAGRIHFVDADSLLTDGRDIIDRARLAAPGQIALSDSAFALLLGAGGSPEDRAKNRYIRYDDSDGEPQGFAMYTVAEDPADFTKHLLEVGHLASATPDAYSALWRFLLEMDLVSTVRAPLRSVEEALPWQLSDHRAARRTAVSDHLWTRILDLPAALGARRYASAAQIILDVQDDLGFADGLYLLTVDPDGHGSVEALAGEAPHDAAAISLSVSDLGSLYLGGVATETLVAAGRVTELRPGSARKIDRVFRADVAPWLSVWF